MQLMHFVNDFLNIIWLTVH